MPAVAAGPEGKAEATAGDATPTSRAVPAAPKAAQRARLGARGHRP